MTLGEDAVFSAQTPAHIQLTTGLAALGLNPECASTLLAYLTILQRWNHTYNLTAITDPEAMVQRHLLDALSIHSYINAQRLADLGSGAGLPGIPLAIACPAMQIDLIESNGKKVRFLREVVYRLHLANVQVIHSRIETVDAPQRYDCLVARALSSLARLATLSAGMLRQTGQLFALKGVYPAEEIAALPPLWSVAAVHRLTVPGLNEQRHLVVLRPQEEG